MRKLFLSFICFFLIVTQVQSFNLTGLTGGYRLVKSGTVTAANTQLSLVDGTAFVYFSGVDLSAYQTGKHLLNIYNQSTGLLIASGYCSATAPGGETLGAELVTNGDFASGDGTGWGEGGSATASEDYTGNELTSTLTSTGSKIYDQHIAFNNGAVFKCAYTTRDMSVNVVMFYEMVGSSQQRYELSMNDTASFYFTGVGGTRMRLGSTAYYTSGQIFTIDDVSVQQVTDPPATGVQIVNSKGGSTQNWLKTGSGELNANINYKIYFVGN